MNMHDAAREILGLYFDSYMLKKKEKEESLTIH